MASREEDVCKELTSHCVLVYANKKSTNIHEIGIFNKYTMDTLFSAPMATHLSGNVYWLLRQRVIKMCCLSKTVALKALFLMVYSYHTCTDMVGLLHLWIYSVANQSQGSLEVALHPEIDAGMLYGAGHV